MCHKEKRRSQTLSVLNGQFAPAIEALLYLCNGYRIWQCAYYIGGIAPGPDEEGANREKIIKAIRSFMNPEAIEWRARLGSSIDMIELDRASLSGWLRRRAEIVAAQDPLGLNRIQDQVAHFENRVIELYLSRLVAEGETRLDELRKSRLHAVLPSDRLYHAQARAVLDILCRCPDGIAFADLAERTKMSASEADALLDAIITRVSTWGAELIARDGETLRFVGLRRRALPIEHTAMGYTAGSKRYSEYAGGTCCPLVMSWPKRIKKDVRGQVRHQYHHCTDIVPTILEACGLEMPKVYKGVKQYPLSGVSMCYTWDAKPDAPTKKERQYYAMLGTRGIWEKGWKALSLHAPLSGHGEFDQDEWELYHVDGDRSESNNVAKDHPEKLKQLINAWFEEAEKNLVLPLDDRSAVQQLGVDRPTEEAPREEYVYYPGASAVPESVAANIRGCSYEIRAEDVVIGIDEPCEGVIFAHGSRFGGHSLFIKDGKLHYVYNFLGIEERSCPSRWWKFGCDLRWPWVMRLVV